MSEENSQSEKRLSAVYIRGLTSDPEINTSRSRLSGVFLDLDFTVQDLDELLENQTKSKGLPNIREHSHIAQSDVDVAKQLNDGKLHQEKYPGVSQEMRQAAELVPLRRASRNSKSVPNISGLGKRPLSSHRLSVNLSGGQSETNVYIRGISQENITEYRFNPYSANDHQLVHLQQNDQIRAKRIDQSNGSEFYHKFPSGFKTSKCPKFNSDQCYSVLNFIFVFLSSTFAIYRIGLFSVISNEHNLPMFWLASCVAAFEFSRSITWFIFTCIKRTHKLMTSFRWRVLLFCGSLLTVAPLLASIPGILNVPSESQNSSSTDQLFDISDVRDILDSLDSQNDTVEFSFDFGIQENVFEQLFSNSTNCDTYESRTISYILTFCLLMVSSFFHGVADSLLRISRTNEENTIFNCRKLVFYAGLLTSSHQLGLLPGFLLASLFTGVSSSNSAFVSLWWIGFIILTSISLMTFVVTLIIHCRQNGSKPYHSTNGLHPLPKIVLNKTPPSDQYHYDYEKGIVRTVLANRCFILVTLSSIFDVLLWSGVLTFLPRYLEDQFDQETWKLNLVIAVCVGLPATAGLVLGAIIHADRWTGFRFRAIALLVCSLLASALAFSMIWIPCGVTSVSAQTIPECNSDCPVSSSYSSPICGSDDVTYFSPCMAGCMGHNYMDDGKTNFTDCSCLPEDVPWAVDGACGTDCISYIPYLIVLACVSFLIAYKTVPSISIINRIFEEVSSKTKSTARVLHAAFVMLLGAATSNLLIGGLADHVFCDVLNDACGHDNTCWRYDVTSLGVFIHSLLAGSQVLSAICLSCLYVFMMKNITSL